MPDAFVPPSDPIDAVITWVDGSAPSHQAARRTYMAAQGEDLHENAANPHRWTNNDEIRFCLHAIANHAPWIRKVWIVSEEGAPNLDGLSDAFRDKITIVCHHDIFAPFDAVFPTFNSLAIESMIWRIDGLADRFLYFNDDVFLASPLDPEDVFRGASPVLRGRWVDYSGLANTPTARDDPAKFNHFMQINAAQLCGYDANHLFASAHVVHPLRRSIMAQLFDTHRDAYLANVRQRFRELSQFLPQGLHNHACLATETAIIRTERDHFHIHSGQGLDKPASETWTLLQNAEQQSVKFLCINDLPQLEQVIPDVRTWLESMVGAQEGTLQ